MKVREKIILPVIVLVFISLISGGLTYYSSAKKNLDTQIQENLAVNTELIWHNVNISRNSGFFKAQTDAKIVHELFYPNP